MYIKLILGIHTPRKTGAQKHGEKTKTPTQTK